MEEKIYDLIIIGGGCAGLTAAVYARRAGKTVLLIEGQVFGGQISYSPSVENYPGYMSISGLEFSDKLFSQAEALGTETELETVQSIAYNGIFKTVRTDYGEHKCKAVIIATGLKHRKTGLAHEDDFVGRGVSYCAVCDGAFYKGKDVAVYGGGNTAVQDAIFLSEICNSVTVIHRRDTFRADEHTVSKMKEKSNIIYELNSTVTALGGEKQLESITVTEKQSGKEKIINIAGLFVAVGQLPQNEAFKDAVALDSRGFVIAGEDCKTSAEGIFAAGDCRTKEVCQLATAVGDGAVSATNACKYIDSL